MVQATRGTHGYQCAEPAVYKALNTWLLLHGISADACFEAAKTALRAGRTLAALDCPHCGFGHVDKYDHALREHAVHTCKGCRCDWR